MTFLNKMKARFGKYAIRGLTKYIIAAYVVGYILQISGVYSGNSILNYLALDPQYILQGQVWRLFTWILTPPTSLSVFTLIMLFCYYQLGTLLERVWGDYFYNLFIFFGLICTVIASFVIYFAGWPYQYYYGGTIFTTYYVSLSIFLGFAMTFPEQRMLLFFIIPIKIKYLAILDIAYLVYEMVRSGYWSIRIQILASLASVIVLLILRVSSKAKNKKRYNNFSRAYSSGNTQSSSGTYKKVVHPGQTQNKKVYLHKCYICGQTDADNKNLEFRYCSKCNGNYEYCQNHLFTHEHVK